MGTFDAEGNYTPRQVESGDTARSSGRDAGGGLVSLKEGQLVSGTVVRVDSECVLVEFGFRTEGVILRRDLTVAGDVDPRDAVKLGDHVEAIVFRLEDREGRLLLSRNLARSEQALADLERRMASGDRTVRGTVVGVVNGGLLVDAGFRAFLPASQIEARRVRDLQPYMGLEIEAKVIEIDRNRRNFVVSRRDLLLEQAVAAEERFLASLELGAIVEGIVADVNLPDAPAMREVRRTLESIPFEMKGLVAAAGHERGSNDHFNDNLSEKRTYLSETDAADAAALLSREESRQLRAYRCASCDGWHVGHLRVNVFVDLGGMDALVPGHELSWRHFEHPFEVVRPGEKVKVRIIAIDRDRRRIMASLRAAQPDPWFEYLATHEVGHLVYGRVLELVPFGAHVQIGADVAGFVRLAEMSIHEVEAPEQVVRPGEELWVKIIGIDEGRRLIDLSIRRAAEGGILAPEYAAMIAEQREGSNEDAR